MAAIVLFLSLSATIPVTSANEIVFGYSADGSPVSSYSNGVIGFCGAVYKSLSSPEKGHTLKEQPLNVDERFEVFAKTLKGKAGIQCGPSSSTYARQHALTPADGAFKGEFTDVFFTTSTKLLIRKDKVAALYANAPLGTVRVGILPSLPSKSAVTPVTSSSIKGLFPQAEFVTLLDKADAVAKLETGEIDAYASDAILLADMQRHNLQNGLERYSIEPPLSNLPESYVLVVYNAPGLVDELNDWMKTADGQHAKAELESLSETDNFSRTLTRIVTWLNRSDHLEDARIAVLFTALLALVLLGVTIGWCWQWWTKPEQRLFSPLEQDERQHFSRELHDTILQSIVVAKRRVELALKQLERHDTAYPATFQTSLQAMDDSIDEVRRMSHEIRGDMGDALDALLKEFKERTGTAVNKQGDVTWKSLPDKTALMLYRVTQEALMNIEKHAKASVVDVSLKKTGRQLQFEIRDNGQGFNTSKRSIDAGIGLKNMRDRIDLLGGKFHLDSAPGRGTLISATIPFNA
jgi:signal transduction histidine kinase